MHLSDSNIVSGKVGSKRASHKLPNSEKGNSVAFFIDEKGRLVEAVNTRCIETSEHQAGGGVWLIRQGRRKRKSQELSERLDTLGMTDRANKMRDCCQSIRVPRCKACGKLHTDKRTAWACRDRFCPQCASRRGAREAVRVRDFLSLYRQANTDRRFYFLTLTFRNTENLLPYSYYVGCFKKLRRQKVWKSLGVTGGLCAFEVKQGSKSGLWHCHFHILVSTDKAVDVVSIGRAQVSQAIAQAWQAITGDSFVTDIRDFDGSGMELVKYVTKEVEKLNDSMLVELVKWSKGKRFLIPFGDFYGSDLLKPEKEEEDFELLTPCDCGCCDFDIETYDWQGGKYHLVGVEPLTVSGGRGVDFQSAPLRE